MTRVTLTALLAGALLAGCPSAECPPGYVRMGDLCALAPDGGAIDGALPSITLVPTPDFVLLHAGQSRSISLSVSAVGVTSAYEIGVTGLPAGVTATTATHATPATPATLTIMFTASASAAPMHADAMVIAMGAGAGLASPLLISVQVAGAPGTNATGAGRVVLWSAPAADESRFVQAVWADAEGAWATVLRSYGTPAAYEDHLLRLSNTGSVVHEVTAHPSAADFGAAAGFDTQSSSAILGSPESGGVFLAGALTDTAASQSLVWLAPVDAGGVRHGQLELGRLSAGNTVTFGATPFGTTLVAGSSSSGFHRYLADLTTDSSFGVDGTVSLTGQLDGVDDAGGLLVHVTAGVTRYHTDGRAGLDSTFAGDGMLELADSDTTHTATILDPFVVGRSAFFVSASSEPTASPGTSTTALVWLVRNDGTVDTGFGGGLVRYAAGYRNEAHLIQVLSDASVLVLVTERDMTGVITDCRVERLTLSGARDASFGPTGDGVHVAAPNSPVAYSDESTGRLYVFDGGSELSFQVFWL